MRHLIQYHKVWEQGSPFVGERPFVFAKNSPQKRSLALQAEKDRDRIWLLYRNSPTDTDYRVAFTFLVSEVAVHEDQIMILGDDVLLPSSLTLCRGRTPWFNNFMERNGRFAFGLREVPPEFAPYFDSLLENI